MRKLIFLTISIVFCLTLAAQQTQNRKLTLHAIGFYNLENLFDTCHDEGKNDFDFLPKGSYHWDKQKYEHKLTNLARVLCDLGTDMTPNGASIIGCAEVENDNVMNALMEQPNMKARGYQYIHIEGPDRRGVDCALIYNPRYFKLEKYFDKHYVYENGDTTRATRPFLCVQGRLAGDKLTVIVCHWPSRGAEDIFRQYGGRQVRAMTDSIRNADPEQHIIVMGDMNDDPDNKSMSKCLGARREIKQMKDGDFYNPWWNILRDKGQGTLSYQGGWNLFDQHVYSHNLVAEHESKLYSQLTFKSCQIFKRDYMIQQEGRYKGTPKRTTSGGVWLDGYSDHLPTVTYLVKAIQ